LTLLANVQDYQKLIDEIEKDVNEKKKQIDNNINKDIDKLKGDIVRFIFSFYRKLNLNHLRKKITSAIIYLRAIK